MNLTWRLLVSLLALSGVEGLARPASAHQVGRSDKLHWQEPCAIVYTDGDAFERLKPHHCDYLLAHQAAEQGRFNEEMTLAQQRAFLMKNEDQADEALEAFDKGKKDLLAKTDPDKKTPGLSPEGQARKLVEDTALLKKQMPPLAEPFGGKKEYLEELERRTALLEKRLEEAKKNLNEKDRAQIAKFEGKLAEPGGSVAGLKGMEKLKDARTAAAGAATFDKDTRRDSAAAEPGKSPSAKVGGAEKGDQLAKGAARADATQRGYQKDDFRKVAQAQGERLGDASETRSTWEKLKERGRNILPAEPGSGARQFAEDRVVADSKVSKEARERAKDVVTGMLENADPRVRQNMVDNNVKLVIIPKGGNLADYAPELKDQRTLDGRCFTLCYNPRTRKNEVGEVKAVADIPMKDGSVVALVPEENLIGKGPIDSRKFPKDFTTIHEFGHMVELYGLPKNRSAADVYNDYTDPDNKRIPTLPEMEQHYKDTVKTSGMDAYGKVDHREYFAQYTSAWFGKHNNGITAEELRKTDPKAYRMMENIYGPPTTIG